MNFIPHFINLFVCLWMLALSVPLGAADHLVAILGESRSDGENKESMNVEVLDRLFTLIGKKQPAAVFFTGDMVLGLTDEIKSDDEQIPAPFGGIYGNQWDRKGFFYDSLSFKKQINSFSSLLARTLGSAVPFYPVIGFNDTPGPDAAAFFRTHFHLTDQVSREASELAYTVTIGNAFFVVFSTSHYDPVLKTVVMHDLNPALLAWIEQKFKENRNKYDFLFAVSNEPAFSTDATQGKFRGFDQDEDNRDAFWRILWQNGVLAYFCSGEHLYDRSNRFGIWQVISGGGGAPLYNRPFDRAFYHYVLLTLPGNKQQPPKVEVFDVQGNLMDAFEIVPRHYPVYQLRIS